MMVNPCPPPHQHVSDSGLFPALALYVFISMPKHNQQFISSLQPAHADPSTEEPVVEARRIFTLRSSKLQKYAWASHSVHMPYMNTFSKRHQALQRFPVKGPSAGHMPRCGLRLSIPDKTGKRNAHVHQKVYLRSCDTLPTMLHAKIPQVQGSTKPVAYDWYLRPLNSNMSWRVLTTLDALGLAFGCSCTHLRSGALRCVGVCQASCKSDGLLQPRGT